MPKRLDARSQSLTSQESYSAVIIADLVAEVQAHPEYDHSVKESRLDDAKMGSEAAVDNLSCTETVHLKGVNGTGISKGVILSAVQFPQIDVKPKGEVGKAPSTNYFVSHKESIKEEFSQMSNVRKIAFGFSFMPSIMFILCFAVIFPCEKLLPCVEEQWSISFNRTEITSNLQVPQNALFTYVNELGPGIRSIGDSSGEIEWEQKLTSHSKFLECGNLATPDGQSCLVMDNKGILHLFNTSNGEHFWELKLREDKKPSIPAIIPDCNNDGVDEIGVAVSKNKIKIIFLGKIITFVEITGCDSTPSTLMTWKKQNETDLIFICRQEENEILVKIPQNKWCIYDKTTSGKISTLISTKSGIISQAKLLSTTEGLILWLNGEITKITKDGTQQWTVSSFNHSNKYRYLMHGKFNKGKPQIVMYSSDIRKNFQMTMLDPETGNVTLSKTVHQMEMLGALLIQGEERDFILALTKKILKSIKNQAVSQISKISASVINILTKEEINELTFNGSSTIEQELTISELDGSQIQILQSEQLSYLEEESYTNTFAAVSKGSDGNFLKVYVFKKSQDNPMEKITTLKSISISNWDRSSRKTSHCVWE